MNSTNLLPNLWRFLSLVAIQVLLLKEISLSIGPYFNILLYPLFILFLPIELPSFFAVLLGFAVGITVDIFYDTPGMHASTGALSGYARGLVFTAMAPRSGYSGKEPIASPAYFGWSWYLQTTALFFAIHLAWYFSVAEFTFVYIGTIALKSLIAWILTMAFVLLYTFFFNPRN